MFLKSETGSHFNHHNWKIGKIMREAKENFRSPSACMPDSKLENFEQGFSKIRKFPFESCVDVNRMCSFDFCMKNLIIFAFKLHASVELH